jgi:hypothetical protein
MGGQASDRGLERQKSSTLGGPQGAFHLLYKALVALIALVIPEVQVGKRVIPHGIEVAKSIVANPALVGLFPRVSEHVLLVPVRSFEDDAADLAGVQLLRTRTLLGIGALCRRLLGAHRDTAVATIFAVLHPFSFFLTIKIC